MNSLLSFLFPHKKPIFEQVQEDLRKERNKKPSEKKTLFGYKLSSN